MTYSKLSFRKLVSHSDLTRREGMDQRPRADAGVSVSPVAGPLKETENTANTGSAGT
jgi:hypothetical protein